MVSSPEDRLRRRMKRQARTLYLLKRAETASRIGLEAVLQDLSVTPGQYTTMALLQTHSEISSAELARLAGVTPQSMSETMAVLERKELITRNESPGNKRVLHIGLTPAGLTLVQLCDRRVDGLETELLSGLDAGQLEAFRLALVGISRSEVQARSSAPVPPRRLT